MSHVTARDTEWGRRVADGRRGRRGELKGRGREGGGRRGDLGGSSTMAHTTSPVERRVERGMIKGRVGVIEGWK